MLLVYNLKISYLGGLQIRQGKGQLKQIAIDDGGSNVQLYQKALKNFETALKMQKKAQGNTAELQEAIDWIKKEADST